MECKGYKITVMPGDGIGPEVIEQALKVLDYSGLPFQYEYARIGLDCYNQTRESLPQETLESIISSDSTLFGAVSTPIGIPEYKSPIIELRRQLQLYANVRPSISLSNNSNIDITIIRENTEDLYSGIERIEDNGNRAVTERIITRNASETIIRYAFDYAISHGKNRVHAVHKANVMKATCGLFLDTYNEIAKEYEDIDARKAIVDAAAMQIITEPEIFQVIVTTNMFGDILSDIASAVAGSIGAAPSGNIGYNYSVFEPIHGSAPHIAGNNRANPIGTIMSAAMMLEHLSQYDPGMQDYYGYSKKIRSAVRKAVKDNYVTRDMGGRLNTTETTNAIIDRI